MKTVYVLWEEPSHPCAARTFHGVFDSGRRAMEESDEIQRRHDESDGLRCKFRVEPTELRGYVEPYNYDPSTRRA